MKPKTGRPSIPIGYAIQLAGARNAIELAGKLGHPPKTGISWKDRGFLPLHYAGPLAELAGVEIGEVMRQTARPAESPPPPDAVDLLRLHLEVTVRLESAEMAEVLRSVSPRDVLRVLRLAERVLDPPPHRAQVVGALW